MKPYNNKIDEFIKTINDTGDFSAFSTVNNEYTFSDKRTFKKFWQNNRSAIKQVLYNEEKYSYGYEKAKDVINRYESGYKVIEFVENLNKNQDFDAFKSYNNPYTFSDKRKYRGFWAYHKREIVSFVFVVYKDNSNYENARKCILSYCNVDNLDDLLKFLNICDVFVQKTDEKQNLKKIQSQKISREVYLELRSNKKKEKLEAFIDTLNKTNNLRIFTNNNPFVFDDGTSYLSFWGKNKYEIKKELYENPKYQNGYDNAKWNLETYEIGSNITPQLVEFIEMINKEYDSDLFLNDNNPYYFSNKHPLKMFWYRNSEKIKKVLNSVGRYQNGYENAKANIQKHEVRIKSRVSPKIIEFIKTINSSYEFASHAFATRNNPFTFENGDSYNTFWYVNKRLIKYVLENNSNFKEGYDLAKENIRKYEYYNSFNNKIQEFINTLNDTFDANITTSSSQNKYVFGDGTSFNSFWNYNNKRIIYELYENPDYQIGYDKAKVLIEICKYFPINAKHIIEFIEKLNDTGDVNLFRQRDNIFHFDDGTSCSHFWNKYSKCIRELLNNNNYYKEGYDNAKEAVRVYEINQRSAPKVVEYIKLLNKTGNDSILKKYNDYVFSDDMRYSFFGEQHREQIIRTLFEAYKDNPLYDKTRDLILSYCKVKDEKELYFKYKLITIVVAMTDKKKELEELKKDEPRGI